MDFKQLNEKHFTPKSTSTVKNKLLRNTVNCDSPFRLLPNVSTPPSRFSKIINPFESHLVDSLHLSTFSPTLFAKVSTPKNKDNFKWTIDEISSLKPADIDEATIDQHIFEEDPIIESRVQEKIEQFFSEKMIAPSPLHQEINRVPLITETPSPPSRLKQYCEGSTQTALSLPPKLPKEVEDILKPYFTYNIDHSQSDVGQNSSLYRKLFENGSNSPCGMVSIQSSPALSTGLSPLQLSPLPEMGRNHNKSLDSPFEMRELRGCSLSPIGRTSPKASRSACRLNFSGRMSVDASLIVPDMCNLVPNQSGGSLEENIIHISPELLSNSTVNWDMEYKHISFTSLSSSNDSEKMDVSNSNTPHSKLFTSQRKRLSDSFKDEDDDFNKENELPLNDEYGAHAKNKVFKDDLTDVGYHTGATLLEDSAWTGTHLFASTPSKRKN